MRRECRLLYLVGQLRPGGLERQLYYLLQTMDRERYRPAVVVWNFSEDHAYVAPIRSLGVPLYGFAGADSKTSKLIKFRRLVRRLNPEVIHSHSFYTNFAASWGAAGTDAIPVGSVRSDFAWAKRDSGLLLGMLSARWPRSQIFNSFTGADGARAFRDLFVPRDLLVVRNGLDLKRFTSTPLSNGGRPKIVAIGSLLAVKRWDRLLIAAFQLKQKGLDFILQIIGEGPMRGELTGQVQSLGLESQVEFLGHRDDVPALLSGATFLAHTSESEGCPNVVMEAMACGRAVVATDVGDVPYLIEDGRTGFVVRCGDDTTLVERMAQLINDRELCRGMGHAGRVKAEREFGLNRLVEETLAAYRSPGWKD